MSVTVARPSSLPLPRTVTDLLPPPKVPLGLSTPSPTSPPSPRKRTIPAPGTLFKPSSLQLLRSKAKSSSAVGDMSNSSDNGTRAGSLSPGVPGRRGAEHSDSSGSLSPGAPCSRRGGDRDNVKKRLFTEDKDKLNRAVHIQNVRNINNNNKGRLKLDMMVNTA